jgi:hypothetical protein
MEDAIFFELEEVFGGGKSLGFDVEYDLFWFFDILLLSIS